MIVSFIFIASLLLGLIGILRIPKSYKKIIWFPIALLIELGLCAFAYGVLCLFGIGFSGYINIAINLAIAFSAFAYEQKTRKKQRHDIRTTRRHELKISLTRIASLSDVVAYGIIIVTVCLCAYMQFGFPISITFLTSDPASHCSGAYAIYDGGVMKNQYLSHLATACIMCCSPHHIDANSAFIPFIVTEILLFAFSGATFYTLLSVECNTLNVFCRTILVFFYMIGYPLNNMLFGFSYLGLGVTVFCGLLVICNSIKHSPSVIKYAVLSLFLFELITSYSLFVPPIYFGVFACLIFFGIKNKEGMQKVAITIVAVFAIPVILGFFIVYQGYFGTDEQTVDLAIAAEGGIYRGLFASFVFIAPLSIFGAIAKTRNNSLSYIDFVSGFFVAFTLALLPLCLIEKVSSYYFYKLYYVLWLIFFTYCGLGIQFLQKKSMGMLLSYAATWLVVFLLAFSGIDTRVSEKNPRLDPTPESFNFFPLYTFNFNTELIDSKRIDNGTIELLSKAENLREEGNKVWLLSNDIILRWYSALNGGDYQDSIWWGLTNEEFLERLDDYDYIIVSEEDPILVNKSYNTYLEALEWAEDLSLVEEIDQGKIFTPSPQMQ